MVLRRFTQTDLEWSQKFGNYEEDLDGGNYTKIFEPDPLQSYPDSVDWRTKGAVTDVKDQVKCRGMDNFNSLEYRVGISSPVHDRH